MRDVSLWERTKEGEGLVCSMRLAARRTRGAHWHVIVYAFRRFVTVILHRKGEVELGRPAGRRRGIKHVIDPLHLTTPDDGGCIPFPLASGTPP